MSRTYCYHCAGRLEQKDERSWSCASCQQTFFENAAAAVEGIITNNQGEVLVVTRAFEPFKGELDFPGGFVDFNETLEEALYRELNEEMSLKKSDLSDPVYIGSYHMPYPWGKDTTQVVVAMYRIKLQRNIQLEANDDVSEARFMKFNSKELHKLLEYRGTGNTAEKVARALQA